MKAIFHGVLLSGMIINSANATDMGTAMAALAANDCEQAVSELQALTEQGNANAMNQLGSMHMVGQCVSNDKAEAKAWFEKSAAAGSKRAEMMLHNFKD